MYRQLEGFPSGQREQTVNLPRKLRRFESFPLHQVQLHPMRRVIASKSGSAGIVQW